MKAKHNIFVLMLCFCVLAFVTPAFAKPKIKMSAKKMTMGVYETADLTLKNAPNCSWKSSNKKVVKVKKTGPNSATISGIKAGKATVTAKYKGKKYKCKITVSKKKSHYKTPKALSNYFDGSGNIKRGVPYKIMPNSMTTGERIETLVGRKQLAESVLNPWKFDCRHNLVWYTVIDNTFAAIIRSNLPFVWAHNRWCYPLQQDLSSSTSGDVAFIGCHLFTIKTGKETDKAHDIPKLVSATHPYIAAVNDPYMPSVLTIRNTAEIPAGTYIELTVSFRGFLIKIPCVLDNSFKNYKLSYPEPNWVRR